MATPRRAAANGAPRLALAGLTLFAFVLRLGDLGRFEFFIDEAATWWYASRIAEGLILEGIRLEPTPPLYYALVAATGSLFGWSDAVLRLPSVIFGSLSVPVLYALVHRLVGGRAFARRAGLAAAALLAVHPLHVVYSREARVYALLLLLTLLVWWAIRRALDLERGFDDELGSGKTGLRKAGSGRAGILHAWAPVVALLVVASYCHYYGLFLFATAGVLVLVGGEGRATRARGVVAVGFAGLLFLPYLLYTLPHLRESGAAWSVEVLYQLFPGDRSFFRVLEMESIGALYPAYLRQLSRPATAAFVRWPALFAQVALGLLGLWSLRRMRRRTAFLLVAWLLPVLLPWAVTHTFRPIFHPGRHDVYGLWGVSALVGVGLARLLTRQDGRRRLAGGVLAVVLAVVLALPILFAAGLRLAALHNIPASDEARRAGAFLAERLDEDDRLVTLANRRLRAERYLRLARPDAGPLPIRSFPAELDAHPGWADPRELRGRLDSLRDEARERVRRFAEEGVDEVFVLPSNPPPEPGERPPALAPIDGAFFRALAAAGWRPVAERSDPELVIYTFVRPPRDA